MDIVRLTKSSKNINLEYRGILIGSLSKEGLRALLSEEEIKPKKVKKKNNSQRDQKKKELIAKARQLGLVYRKLHAKHYRRKIEPNTAFTEKELNHLCAAVKIMRRVGCSSYKQFINAQIEGLKFVNGGKGVFPLAAHLSTFAAETRMLENMNAVKNEQGDVVKVSITDQDKRAPLMENMRYLTKRERIKDGTASREDAVFVCELQLIKKGKVDQYILDFLDQLNG